MKHKKILTLLIIALASIAIIILMITKKGSMRSVILPVQGIEFCYSANKPTERGFSDRAWLRFTVTGEGGSNVTGEYHNLPAEKDSKTGTFTGTIGVLDQQKMGRTAMVWWDVRAEGMQYQEEFIFEFGDGSAVAKFGEMIDRGDGTYVYKDKQHLTNGLTMDQISCEDFTVQQMVQQYVRDHVNEIVPQEPVLGGTWYIVSTTINPRNQTGVMTYEDGHIQGSATFSFKIRNNSVTISDVVAQ